MGTTECRKMSIVYIILKILMWTLIAFFSTDAIMQYISYSFYKGDRQLANVAYIPVEISYNDSLSGYGYNLDTQSDKVILFFGGSTFIAYNSVGTYAGKFNCPFLSAGYNRSLLYICRTAQDIFHRSRPFRLSV